MNIKPYTDRWIASVDLTDLRLFSDDRLVYGRAAVVYRSRALMDQDCDEENWGVALDALDRACRDEFGFEYRDWKFAEFDGLRVEFAAR